MTSPFEKAVFAAGFVAVPGVSGARPRVGPAVPLPAPATPAGAPFTPLVL